ncbi:hypothetical protein RJ640_008226 [Escallonia rubra]|uniref:Uncharacterized protein n=1 Tax=Escallonia rubra TaxID=112253 RepID=A0AA88QBI3_9ASTE|nr:hypothetical protein RJ640_008226 [Escallonia rubra]
MFQGGGEDPDVKAIEISGRVLNYTQQKPRDHQQGPMGQNFRRVKWVNNLSEWSAGNAVAFYGSHQNNLSGPDRQDALGVNQAWVAQVVESTFA